MSQIVDTYTQSVNLSSLSIGDTCHISGGVSLRFSGVSHGSAGFNSFLTWSSSNTLSATGTWSTYTYTYTITLTSSSFTIVAEVDDDRYSYGGDMSLSFYIYKSTDPWLKVSKAYKKVSGSWVEQSDLTTVFDPTKHYKKGD